MWGPMLRSEVVETNLNSDFSGPNAHGHSNDEDNYNYWFIKTINWNNEIRMLLKQEEDTDI